MHKRLVIVVDVVVVVVVLSSVPSSPLGVGNSTPKRTWVCKLGVVRYNNYTEYNSSLFLKGPFNYCVLCGTFSKIKKNCGIVV